MSAWRFLFGTPMRALWIVAVPLLAAIGAAAAVMLSPPVYQSRVVVTFPQLPDEPLTEYVLTPYADHVVAVLTYPAAAGLEGAPDTVRLTATHEQGGRLIQASATGRDREHLEGMLEPLVRNALISVMESDVIAAEERLTLARGAYDQARSELDGVVERAGVVDVAGSHDDYAGDMTDWLAVAAADRAAGDGAGASQAAGRASAYAGRREALASLLPDYARARDQFDLATALLTRAEEGLIDAQAVLRTAAAPTTVRGGAVLQLSRREPLLRAVAVAVTASAALVVAGLAAFDVARDRWRERLRPSSARRQEPARI